MHTPDSLQSGSTEAGAQTELDRLLNRPGAHGDRIDIDVDAFAGCLPQLGECVAMTANATALISQLGAYAPASFTGEPLAHSPDAVTLRMHRPSVRSVVAMDADEGRYEPPALGIVDEQHSALHRVYLVAKGSALPLDLLRPAPSRSGDERSEKPAPDQTTDQLGIIDTVLADSGVSFRKALPGFRPSMRSRVESGRVVDLLRSLCHSGIPLTIGVPNRGCLQLHRGTLDVVEPRGDLLSIVSGSCNVTYQPGDVSEAWIVRFHSTHGPSSMVQLYSLNGRCIVLLAQIGMVGAGLVAAWEQILGGLLTHET